jgi:hypothetical protein
MDKEYLLNFEQKNIDLNRWNELGPNLGLKLFWERAGELSPPQ